MDASIYLIVTVILMGDIEWKDFQIEYFSHLVEDELAKSTANDKQKDARIKTSSLKDL